MFCQCTKAPAILFAEPRGDHYLMGTTDQIQVVLVQEFGYDLGAKGKRHPPVVLPPAQHILVWIRPQQVAQQALVGHVSGAHDASDLLHGLKVG